MLSRVVRQKFKRRQDRTTKLLTLLDEDLEIAKLEDEWENSMDELSMNQSNPANRVFPKQDSSFRYSVNIAFSELSDSLAMEKADLVARGRAMWKLVQEEQALAIKEQALGHQASNKVNPAAQNVRSKS
jgi:hypothetical protein